MSDKLQELKSKIEEMNRYSHVGSLLYWDMRTVMPNEGFAKHSDAMSAFSEERFRLGTSDELYRLLCDLKAPEEWSELDGNWKFIVSEMYDSMERERRIPKELYAEFVRESNESERAWEEAKRASDYSIFAPHLRKMIELVKTMTGYTDPGKDVYDTLLGDYEKGMDSATVDRIFEELKVGLLPLVARILAAPQPDDSKFRRTFDLNGEREVQSLLLSYIGFNWERGTVGETEHPFTLNFSCHDVRVSNHFRENDALDPMFSAIHEGGHAIYEQNVDEALDGTVGGSCSYLGIHESQSRFYENILGRNINFWVPIYPEIQKRMPELADISLEEFAAEINHVRNSLIRIMADEVTYCLHIIIRYEIEKAIFRDGIDVDELPALWNRKMKEYLQVEPQNDADGILQDMHWSDGSFGYFPTYLLGSIYDGMFLDALQDELGPVDDLLKDGKIGDITAWLNRKIHVYGSTRRPKEIIASVCGKDVTAEPLLRYFREKYSRYYDIG